MERYVLVYGAYGHTGRFVVTELLRRGLTPILSGRDSARLGELAAQFPGLEVRQASVDDAGSLADAVRRSLWPGRAARRRSLLRILAALFQ